MRNSSASGAASMPNQARVLATIFKARGIPGVRRNN